MKLHFLKRIFHPYLVCLYIIFNAINVIVEFDLIEFLGIALGFFFFVFLVNNINQKYVKVNNYQFSYLLSCTIYTFFFSYEITSFFSEITFISFRLRYVILFLSLLLSVVFYLLFKSKREFIKLNLYLNLLFFFFCGFEVYNFIEQNLSQTEPKPVNKNTTKPKPNIYFLMLDGYANNKSLAKYWGHDNRPFTDSLQKLGFKYIEDSKSDYLFTVQTVASLLNFEKINDKDKVDNIEMIKKIRLNKLTQQFSNMGYDIENLSIFNIFGTSNKYNFWFGDTQKNIVTYMFSKSIIGRYLESLNKSFEAKQNREASIDEELKQIIKRKDRRPKLVFYHSLQVHHPFQNEDDKRGEYLMKNIQGNKNDFQSLGSIQENKKWMREYIQQIYTCNKKTMLLITEILKYDPQCNILLFSDHGFRFLAGVSLLDARKESFLNFSAVYMTKSEYKDPKVLNTPTEIVRYIFDEAKK